MEGGGGGRGVEGENKGGWLEGGRGVEGGNKGGCWLEGGGG